MHKTVLKKEAIDSLDLKPNSVVVDCTLGVGGHAGSIVEKLSSQGVFLGIDADESAVSSLEKLKASSAEVHLVCGNFRNLKSILSGLSLTPTAILADLGWRTDQFESGGKGFSFTSDDPLLMTYGDPASYTFTAADVVNDWAEESIADVIYGYGEEQYSRRIAKAIVENRKSKVIDTAAELAKIVESATPVSYHRKRIHPATKTFQALRIVVNDELGSLETLLKDGFQSLAPGGRMTIISFHSLEDRLVKKTFRELEHDKRGRRINKKPIIATKEELEVNPRARSAKLRTIEKQYD